MSTELKYSYFTWFSIKSFSSFLFSRILMYSSTKTSFFKKNDLAAHSSEASILSRTSDATAILYAANDASRAFFLPEYFFQSSIASSHLLSFTNVNAFLKSLFSQLIIYLFFVTMFGLYALHICVPHNCTIEVRLL